MKKNINKMDFIKIEIFCSVKDDVKRMKRKAIGQKKISAKHIFDKGTISKIHKDFLNSHNTKNNPINISEHTPHQERERDFT